jgi:large subunit ribosomal protein L35
MADGHAQPLGAASGAPERCGRRKVTKMPKLKNKSAARKRFRFTGGGKIRANSACRRHNLRRRPQKMKRQSRGTMILPDDAMVVAAKYFPYK